MNTASAYCDRIVNSRSFEFAIIGLILVNAAMLGFSTSGDIVERFGDAIDIGYRLILGVFIIEAIMKMVALSPNPLRYFRDGWNIFDFTVIVFSLVPATGAFAMIARLGRLLRVLRLVSTIEDLRLIVAALVRSIPNVGHIMILMSIIVYIYAIIGFQLFHEIDPSNWGTIWLSILTLFEIITLEGWVQIMEVPMEVEPYSWIYFVSFVIVGTFVVVNLFIAVVINNLDKAKDESFKQLQVPVTRDELLQELRETRDSLRRLESRLDGYDNDAPTSPK